MPKRGTAYTATVLAWDTSANAPKTGDAANITLYVSKDGGTPTAITPGTVSEMSSTNAPGSYKIALSTTEMDAAGIEITGKSSTANVVIYPKSITTEMDANLTTIDGNATLTGDAVLSLKQLNVVNDTGTAVVINSNDAGSVGMSVSGPIAGLDLVGESNGWGLRAAGTGTGGAMALNGSSGGRGLKIESLGGFALDIFADGIADDHAINIVSDNGKGIYVSGATAGIDIDTAAGDGINVSAPAGNGIAASGLTGIFSAGTQLGMFISGANAHGLQIDSSSDHAVEINASAAGKHAVVINSVAGRGINIESADNCLFVESSGDNAVEIRTTGVGGKGVYFFNTGDCVDMVSSAGDGVSINASGYGMTISGTTQGGVYVSSTNGKGVYINAPGNIGLDIHLIFFLQPIIVDIACTCCVKDCSFRLATFIIVSCFCIKQ